MKSFFHRYKHKAQKAIDQYHTSKTWQHHHSKIIGFAVGLFSAILAWNFGVFFQGDTKAYAAQEGDTSIIALVLPAEFEHNQSVAITIDYTTQGTQSTGTTITLDLPKTIILQETTVDYTSQTDSGDVVQYIRSNLEDSSDSISLVAVGSGYDARSGSLETSVTAAGVIDTNLKNNTDRVSLVLTQSEVQGGADLYVNKESEQDTVRAGNDVNYTITYGNNGTQTGEDVYVFSVLPERLNYKSATPSPDLISGNSLRRDIGTLAASLEYTITLETNASLLLDSGSTLFTETTIEGTTIDPVSNNTSSFITIVQDALPLLELEKGASNSQVQVGDQITYTYIFTNTGVGPAQNVVLTDIFPAEYLEYFTGNLTPTVVGNNYIRDIGNLSPRDSGVIEVTFTTKKPGTLNETAFISCDTFDEMDDVNTYLSSFSVQVVPAQGGGSDTEQEDDTQDNPAGGSSIPVIDTSHNSASNTEALIEQQKGVTYAQELGYIKSSSMSTSSQVMTRGDLAKFMVLFLLKEMDTKPDLSKGCSFPDTNLMSAEIRAYTATACQYGIMGIDIDTFNPGQPLDRATVATVISRVLFGSMFNTVEPDWYTQHARALKHIGVMKNIGNLSEPMLQQDTMIMVERLHSSGLSQKIREKVRPYIMK